MLTLLGRKVRRAVKVTATRLRWGWRLGSLGHGVELGRPLLVRNPRCVAIGDRVSIERDFVLADLAPHEDAGVKITIGEGCTMLFRFQVNAARSVVIGRDVLFASNVLITDSDHVVDPEGLPVTRSSKLVTRPVSIGDNCWIGQNVVILKGVTIGDHCIIGANSVVTRDVPARSVACGNPARVVKSIEPSASSRADRRNGVERSIPTLAGR